MASRRAAEALILAGRVSVNGRVVRTLGTRADPRRDAILVDGERIVLAPRRTIVLHKPRGVVSTLADPEGRPTVRRLLGGVRERLFPVGRLDLNTTGLLLLTNDGTLSHRLLHPSRGLARVYHAKVSGAPGEEAITRLRRGVRLEDGKTAPARVRVLERLPTKTWLELTVNEGRHHLVRRMCAAVGHPVEKLARVRLGPLVLGSLPVGGWRDLVSRELEGLRAAAGLSVGGGAARGRPRRGRGRRAEKPRPRSAPPPRGRGRDGALARPAGGDAAPPRDPRRRHP